MEFVVIAFVLLMLVAAPAALKLDRNRFAAHVRSAAGVVAAAAGLGAIALYFGFVGDFLTDGKPLAIRIYPYQPITLWRVETFVWSGAAVLFVVAMAVIVRRWRRELAAGAPAVAAPAGAARWVFPAIYVGVCGMVWLITR